MRKIITTAFAAILLAGCAAHTESGEPSIFEGRFIGYNDEFVEFFLVGPDGDYVEVPITVAEDGTFCDTLTFGTQYDCALFADRFMFRVCIESGKHYNAEFDLTTGSETDFRFYGDGEKENLFLSHYWSSFNYVEDLVRKLSGCTSFEEYSAGVHQAADVLNAELAAIDNKPFVEYHTAKMNSSMATYTNYYSMVRLAATGTYRPEKSYLEAIKNAPKLDNEAYTVMVTTFALNAPYIFPDINIREGLRAVSDFSDKKERQDEAIAVFLNSYVDAGCNGSLEDAYAYYKENVKNIDEDLCKKIENAMTLGPGAQAPEIEFADINGKVFHLADFVGKPLYIDLWASWCGPCCAEIPYLQKLVDQLGTDPEIVCISISIDDERDNWTAKLAEENSTWPQYLATPAGMTAISKEYGVSGIPRFLLINADGTIASVNAARPSTPDVLETLRQSLR